MPAERNPSPSELSALREVAVTVAREAADHVRARRGELFGPPGSDGTDSVRTKSTHTDPVTVADTESEDLIRARLRELRPGDAFLGEESGSSEATGTGETGVCWVVDPIDGTVNFVYGIPASAVSVAAQVDGRSIAGAVVDITSGDTYSAALGAGATLTDARGTETPLRCNPVTDLGMSLVATGFSYTPGRRAHQGAIVAALLPRVRDIRRIGAAALDLCMVAAGRVDAHYEHGLNPWDWAAGALVAAEAGATVRVPGGFGDAGEITVAAAPGIAVAFNELLAELGANDAAPN
ncbi:inositol monophosphatase family protein [Rhodococcus sp. (in: high G+C Gram-positive bacteria)]|uniref:inositol monophosphatase family protein n=1 Tax=unclassified Rhodococcus (in: high G+C Gram-positive bacteria) TaxID=192944 RepID=UPI001A010601|nr:inositol monophosphatase family protein [Rhodococcus sp. (in: high G+C Gram-positive bacteria)]MBF0663281.1 inositol monophosphatase [Rhodococcus sp. (in: high G+C Gram-positive bacteria)]